MPVKRTNNSKLKHLIAEQETDRKNYYTFPERINPRRQLLFPALTPRIKACFILSFFMKRKEIALALKIKSLTVSKHRKRGLKVLTEEEIQRYRGVHFGR